MKKISFLIGGGAWLYLCLCFVLLASAPVLTGDLVESDDYMRMVRVFDLLAGQGNVNYIQPRLGPAGGTGVSWSPLIDAPLGALVWCLDFFTDRTAAALIAATIWPLVLLAAFIAASLWYVRSVLDEKTARWAPVSLLLLGGMLAQFFPGRIDHHSVQLIVLVLIFGCLLRGYQAPLRKRWPAIAGLLMALSWSIGAESIPWVALSVSVAGAFWLAAGQRFTRFNLVLGAALFAGAAALLPLTRGFSGFLVTECDGISRFHLALAGIVPLFWLAMAALPEDFAGTMRRRLLWAVAGGACTFFALYYFFPQCLHDPYGVDDPDLRRIWLSQVNEVRPALDYSGQPGILVFYLGPLLLALGVCIAQLRRGADVLLLAITGALLWALGLGLWQIRTAYLGHALSILPLTEMLGVAGAHFSVFWRRGENDSRRRRVFAALFFVAGALVFFAGTGRHDVVPARAERPRMAQCDLKSAALVMNTIREPQTIAAYVTDGAELLFRTHHRVLAASYHRDAEGILAAHRLLMAAEEGSAREIAKKYDVGLIMVCERHLPYWRETAGIADPFAAALWKGEAPSWLRLLGEGKGFRIYKIRRS